jgi:hypothetical protein
MVVVVGEGSRRWRWWWGGGGGGGRERGGGGGHCKFTNKGRTHDIEILLGIVHSNSRLAHVHMLHVCLGVRIQVQKVSDSKTAVSIRIRMDRTSNTTIRAHSP